MGTEGIYGARLLFFVSARTNKKHLHQWWRGGCHWVISATPGQPQERKKHHGAIQKMITASSHVLSLSPETVPKAMGIYGWAIYFFCKNTDWKKGIIIARPDAARPRTPIPYEPNFRIITPGS
jgi:hypothetical protein